MHGGWQSFLWFATGHKREKNQVKGRFALVHLSAYLAAMLPVTGIGAPVTVPTEGGRAWSVDASAVREPVEIAQVTIEQRIIIRVPVITPADQRPPRRGPFRRRLPPPEAAFAPPPGSAGWAETKAPRCIPARVMQAAQVQPDGTLDLLLRDRTRIRARLSRDCIPADFYAGFYIQPASDGSICAGRDSLLARSGMSCEIRSFKRLVPGKP